MLHVFSYSDRLPNNGAYATLASNYLIRSWGWPIIEECTGLAASAVRSSCFGQRCLSGSVLRVHALLLQKTSHNPSTHRPSSCQSCQLEACGSPSCLGLGLETDNFKSTVSGSEEQDASRQEGLASF